MCVSGVLMCFSGDLTCFHAFFTCFDMCFKCLEVFSADLIRRVDRLRPDSFGA